MWSAAEGTHSNRDAIARGAAVGREDRDSAASETRRRYLSHSSRVVHFGLGDHTKVDRIEIRWPRGIVQRLDHPEINTLLQIREPAR